MSDSRVLETTPKNLSLAATKIHEGGIVAYPTETVFGLGVDFKNGAALAKLFELKGRPPERPVLLLVSGRGQIDELVARVPKLASDLMERLWPGPVTLVLPARSGLSPYITSNTDTIAVRQASPGVSADLIARFGGPITSTSANRTGEPPSTNAAEAVSWIDDPDVLILEGVCDLSAKPSTLVDATGEVPRVLRQGAVAEDLILKM